MWDVLQNVLQKVILKEEHVLGFEWDEQKSIINLKKHGIAFEEASEVFLDDNRLEMYDAKHSYDEDRFIAIGKVKKVLFVVYVERDVNIRIISARAATKREENLYYGDGVL